MILFTQPEPVLPQAVSIYLLLSQFHNTQIEMHPLEVPE